MTITKHDAIKCLSNAIAYAKVREETWADNIYVPALEVAVRVMAAERKKGKWVAQKGGGYRCSECKHYALDERDGNLVHVSVKTKFCPYCGTDMREEKEDG